MSARCEPREELRDVDGWHWLTEHNPVLWIADRQEWEWGEDDWVTPEAAYRYGYRYLAPVATPAGVDALRAEVEQAHSYLDRLLQNTHPQCEPLPDLWGLCTQIDNMVTDIPKLRAEVERLRGALSPLVAVIPDICNALDLDPDETSIRVRVDGGARDGEVLAERTLADMLTVARAALAKEPGNEG